MNFRLCRTFASRPRLSRWRAVSGNVEPDDRAGRTTDRCPCLTGFGSSRGNRKIAANEASQGVCLFWPLDGSKSAARKGNGGQKALREPMLHGSLLDAERRDERVRRARIGKLRWF